MIRPQAWAHVTHLRAVPSPRVMGPGTSAESKGQRWRPTILGALPWLTPSPTAEGMGTPVALGEGGQQPADSPTRSLNELIPSTAELIKLHPGDFPLIILSFTKRRSPLWKIQSVDAKRSNLETIINRSWAHKGCGMHWFQTHPISFPYGETGRGGQRAGWNSGPVSWRREDWGVDVPRLLWNVHKITG